MARLARPEWSVLGAGTFFLLIGGGAGLAYPQAIRVIIDGTLTSGREVIDRAALAMAAIFFIQGVAVAFRHYLFTVAGERIVARLREAVYRSLLRQEIAFFDGRRTGELMSRLSSDTTVIQSTVTVNVSMTLRNILMVVGGLALMMFSSPFLTLLMLMIVPFVALGAVAVGRRISKLSKKTQDAIAKAGEAAEETIAGIRTVRSFSKESVEAGRYSDAVWASFSLARFRILVVSIFVGSVTLASYGTVAAVLWFGGRMVVDGEMTVGGLTSFTLYTLTVAVSISSLGSLWSDFMRAGGASERVFELLDRIPEMTDGGRQVLAPVAGRIELRGVGFSYPSRPDVPVLEALDLVLEPGGMIAIVGHSGAGKSTIAGLIPRLYDPTEGQILLDGVDIRDLESRWYRDQVGVVAQEPLLFSTSIAANIKYGAEDASDLDVEGAARAAHAHDFISGLPEGYQTEVGERGVQLSGGQKQRVAIARALLKDPPILILDEATSALDSESEALVQRALERLMKNRTSLVIAHRLSTVRSADRVIVLDAGRVIERGTHQELIERDGVYRRLVRHQFFEA